MSLFVFCELLAHINEKKNSLQHIAYMFCVVFVITAQNILNVCRISRKQHVANLLRLIVYVPNL